MSFCFVRALREESTIKWPRAIIAGLKNGRDWAEWGVRTTHDNICTRPKLITFGHFQVELYYPWIGVVVHCDIHEGYGGGMWVRIWAL